jgi:hypothetical protein
LAILCYRDIQHGKTTCCPVKHPGIDPDLFMPASIAAATTMRASSPSTTSNVVEGASDRVMHLGSITMRLPDDDIAVARGLRKKLAEQQHLGEDELHRRVGVPASGCRT